MSGLAQTTRDHIPCHLFWNLYTLKWKVILLKLPWAFSGEYELLGLSTGTWRRVSIATWPIFENVMVFTNHASGLDRFAIHHPKGGIFCDVDGTWHHDIWTSGNLSPQHMVPTSQFAKFAMYLYVLFFKGLYNISHKILKWWICSTLFLLMCDKPGDMTRMTWSSPGVRRSSPTGPMGTGSLT